MSRKTSKGIPRYRDAAPDPPSRTPSSSPAPKTWCPSPDRRRASPASGRAPRGCSPGSSASRAAATTSGGCSTQDGLVSTVRRPRARRAPTRAVVADPAAAHADLLLEALRDDRPVRQPDRLRATCATRLRRPAPFDQLYLEPGPLCRLRAGRRDPLPGFGDFVYEDRPDPFSDAPRRVRGPHPAALPPDRGPHPRRPGAAGPQLRAGLPRRAGRRRRAAAGRLPPTGSRC